MSCGRLNASWKISSSAVDGQSFLVIDGSLLSPFPFHKSIPDIISFFLISSLSILCYFPLISSLRAFPILVPIDFSLIWSVKPLILSLHPLGSRMIWSQDVKSLNAFSKTRFSFNPSGNTLEPKKKRKEIIPQTSTTSNSNLLVFEFTLDIQAIILFPFLFFSSTGHISINSLSFPLIISD